MTRPDTSLPADKVAEVAGKLTRAGREIVVASEPGGWGRSDEACGANLCTAGEVAAARALQRRGLGDVEDHQPYFPRFLYFNNSLGLAVRSHLQQKGEQ